MWRRLTSLTGVHEEHPVGDLDSPCVSITASGSKDREGRGPLYLDILPTTFGVTDLMLRLVISVDEVLHNTPAFEDPDQFAIRKRISNCRDPAVGIDLQELLGFLI